MKSVAASRDSWSTQIEKVLENRYTPWISSLAVAAAGSAGRLPPTWTIALYVLAGAIGCFSLYRRRPKHFQRHMAALVAMLLALYFWVRPAAEAVYAGVLAPQRQVLFEAGKPPQLRFEIGDSGAWVNAENPQALDMFPFLDGSKLIIEVIDGELKVSADIIDVSGDLVASLVRNEWSVARSPTTWDRNYTTDALEVKNAQGRVVLQIRVLPDRIRLQGEWWGRDGKGVRMLKAPTSSGIRGMFIKLGRDTFGEQRHPEIAPMFRYPSALHLGELLATPRTTGDGRHECRHFGRYPDPACIH